ncbi:hypothetical protein TCSYLVIO_003304 [Trypanosoma cruzi]|nr:hypothetical protein TCSYLVIO_003304 [Trypanosoma cruzi]
MTIIMDETDTNVAELPIAYYVLLAEFDIDTGSCLRVKYPSVNSWVEENTHVEGNTLCGVAEGENDVSAKWFDVLDLDDDYCASHMLPDGAEKQVVSRTIFIVNRSKPANVDCFPVYCFTLAESTRAKELEITCIKSNAQSEWVRHTSTGEAFLHEELHYNQTTGEVLVRSKGSVVWGPLMARAPDAFQVFPTLPRRVAAFAQEIEKGFASQKANGAGIRDSLEKDTAPFSDSTLVSPANIAGYSFFVICVDSKYHGFLTQSTQLELLMKSKTMPQPPPGAATTREEEEKGNSSSRVLHRTESSNVPPLYGLCAVVTRQDSSVRRGGISKSVALLGPKLVWLESFFPILVETALQCCDIKGKTEEALEQQTVLVRRCFEAVEKATCALQRSIRDVAGISLEHEVMRRFTTSGRQANVSCAVLPFGTSHSLHIPLFPEMYDFVFSRYGLEQMVEVCGASFWTVVTAILLEKRVVVLSRQGLANDVCEAALSLGLIGNLLDPHFVTKKVFPYTSVNGLSHFCSVPGYIVGTLNPIFEMQHTWWDVLCDLDNKCVVLAPECNSISQCNGTGIAGGKASGWATQDAQFAKDILSKVYQMKVMRKSLQERNHLICLMLEEYFALMIMVGEAPDHILSRFMQTNFLTPSLARLRALAQGSSLFSGMPGRLLLPGEDPSLIVAVATLRRASNCDEMELIRTLNHLLSFLCSSKEVILLLRRMPLALGGLNPLASQLLHTSPLVRQAALELMRRVEVFPPGRDAIAAMNSFFCMVYESASRDA